MRINNISIQSKLSVGDVNPADQSGSGDDFGGMLKKLMSNVNDLQSNADVFAKKIAVGDDVEIHQAMIAMQKAVTALQFTVQVRNKVLEAYQEIMRTQV